MINYFIGDLVIINRIFLSHKGKSYIIKGTIKSIINYWKTNGKTYFRYNVSYFSNGTHVQYDAPKQELRLVARKII
jgi:hypothetical protein